MSENQVVVLKTLDEVKTQLNMIRQNNLTDALQYSLQAQLNVVTSTESFDLGNHAFSAMLDSFKHALSAVTDENERLELQKRNSLMIANLFFFSEAKIKFLEQKNSEEGKKLLQQGCELLVDTTGELLNAVDSRSEDILVHAGDFLEHTGNVLVHAGNVLEHAEGITKEVVKEIGGDAVKQLAPDLTKFAFDTIAIATSMAKNFDAEKVKKFIVPGVGFVADKLKFQKLKDEFDEFMQNSARKLYENKDLYYPTIQLTDYIRPYEEAQNEIAKKLEEERLEKERAQNEIAEKLEEKRLKKERKQNEIAEKLEEKRLKKERALRRKRIWFIVFLILFVAPLVLLFTLFIRCSM